MKCFQDFTSYVKNQFDGVIKILRSGNGIEYTNMEFKSFLLSKGIQHQSTCSGTPAQSGVAEQKNHHLLEVARALMFQMNMPKFLWSDAVLTATYLINRMPSRVLRMKSPCQIHLGENKFIVPPKVFGCTCFVRYYRPAVGKLDPRTIKCIFVGYSPSQKGYLC